MNLLSDVVRNHWFIQGTTDQSAGNLKEPANQARVLDELGLSSDNLITCKQVHGDRIAIVHDHQPRVLPETDGLLTDLPSIVLGVFSADCVPIFLLEPNKKVVGVLHSGWRGTVSQIARKGVELVRKNWNSNAADAKVYLGPHIQDCCYKVGAEVAQQFPASFRKDVEGGALLSLKKAIVQQVKEAGVPAANIRASDACTHCDPRFYSYRRDKTENRMLSFITRTRQEPARA